MNSLVGEQLGDYRILQAIGAGGMGQVYLAEHVHLRKRYAVKILPAELAEDPDFVDRFHDEARVMAELRHPRIVQVHYMGQARGWYFLAMDYVTGPDRRPVSLHEHIKAHREGRFAESQVRTWATQIAEALEYAHEHGIVHRDLKPANILIDAKGDVKLTDFGLAKTIGHEFVVSQIHAATLRSLGSLATSPAEVSCLDAHEPVTGQEAHRSPRSRSASSILGTYDYMAPEQRGEIEAPIDQRTDLFAFGLVIYRLLTGRRPGGLAMRPSQLVPSLSRSWDAIVDRCLAYHPDDRFSSATQLLANLRRPSSRGSRRMPVVIAATTVLLALGALHGPTLFSHGHMKYLQWQVGQSEGAAATAARERALSVVPSDSDLPHWVKAETLLARGHTALKDRQPDRARSLWIQAVTAFKAAEAEAGQLKETAGTTRSRFQDFVEVNGNWLESRAAENWKNAQVTAQQANRHWESKHWADADRTYEQALSEAQAVLMSVQESDAAEQLSRLHREIAELGKKFDAVVSRWPTGQAEGELTELRTKRNTLTTSPAWAQSQPAREGWNSLIHDTRVQIAETEKKRFEQVMDQARQAGGEQFARSAWEAVRQQQSDADQAMKAGRLDEAAVIWKKASAHAETAKKSATEARGKFDEAKQGYEALLTDATRTLLKNDGGELWSEVQRSTAQVKNMLEQSEGEKAIEVYQNATTQTKLAIQAAERLVDRRKLEAELADKLKEAEQFYQRNKHLLDVHGGDTLTNAQSILKRLAGSTSQPATAPSEEKIHADLREAKNALSLLEKAKEKAARINDHLLRANEIAQGAGLTLASSPDFITPKQTAATRNALDEVKKALDIHPADREAGSLRNDLGRWLERPGWQAEFPSNPDQAGRIQRLAAEHYSRSLTRSLALSDKVKLDMVLLPPGIVPARDGRREIVISRPYYVSVTEITQEHWLAVMKDNPSHFQGNANPVDSVTFEECVEFCRRAAAQTRSAVRLPNEEEWEYACLAGSIGAFAFGDNVDRLGDYAWYLANAGSDSSALPVRGRQANAWGLFDMHGNVGEWCGQTLPGKESTMIVKGGSFAHAGSDCACSARRGESEKSRSTRVGFRIVESVDR